MKGKNIYKFSLILVIFAILISFLGTKSFAGATCNYDISTLSDEEKAYMKSCSDVVLEYCSENNISFEDYPYYFVFMVYNGSFSLTGTGLGYRILLASSDVQIKSSFTYSFYGNSGIAFDFAPASTDILNNPTPFKLSAAFGSPNVKVFYTNYSNNLVNSNDSIDFYNPSTGEDVGGNTGGDIGGGDEPEDDIVGSNYKFIGFDGTEYELPPLPDKVNDYTHYVIVKNSNNIVVFCFNESLEVTRDNSFVILNADNDTTGKLFTYRGTYWDEAGEQGTYSFALSNNPTFIHSCPDLTQYGEELNGEESFFLNPQTVLPPIVEKIRLGGVQKEVLIVVPVVAVVVVALISLRKAIAFLIQILRQA